MASVKYWDEESQSWKRVGMGGSVSNEQIAQAVEDYMAEHPVEVPEVDLTGVVKSVNGKTPDENGNVEIAVSGSSQNADLTEFDTRLSALENAGDTAGIFTGKTASFYGDSLTEKNYHYSNGYHKWVSDILGLASYNNYGVSGYKVSDVYNKVNSIADTADIIFVMCGVNDQNFSVPLGAMGDTTTGTTYGALSLLCAKLKEKYPTKLVVFITPHYQTKYPHSAGITSYEVSKAVREVCEKYAIPVYDNFVLSGIYSTNLSTFTTDNCHWNDTAHEMVGKNLARFMVNTFRYIHGNNSGGGTHTHSYTESVTTAATCTIDGVKTFICDCGDKYTQSIPATGHKWNDGVVTVEPTETTQGVKTYTCTVCGETRTETIPALDHEHSYTSTVVPPTCTEQGYTEHVCTCGDSYKDNYVAATGHSYTSEVTTEATCTTDGVRTYTCSVCGDTYTETIAATGHNYVDGVCSACGAETWNGTPAIINNSVSSATYENQTLTLGTKNQNFYGVTFPGAQKLVFSNISSRSALGWVLVPTETGYKAVGLNEGAALSSYGETYNVDATLATWNKREAGFFEPAAEVSVFTAEIVDNVAHFYVDGVEMYSVEGTALGYARSDLKKATFALAIA